MSVLGPIQCETQEIIVVVVCPPSKTDPAHYSLSKKAGSLGGRWVTPGQLLGPRVLTLCPVSPSPQAERLSPQGRGGPEQNPLLQGAYQL